MLSKDILTLICSHLPAATRGEFMKLSHDCWDTTMRCSENVEIDAKTLTKHRVLAQRSKRWSMNKLSLVKFDRNRWDHVTVLTLTNNLRIPERLYCSLLPSSLQSLSIKWFNICAPESLKRLPLVNFKINIGTHEGMSVCFELAMLPNTLKTLYCSSGYIFQSGNDIFPHLRKCTFVNVFLMGNENSYPIGCVVRKF